MESKKSSSAKEGAAGQTQEEKPMCFVIMPISDPDGYESGHFNKILSQIFAPAIDIAGYKPHRVDQDFTSSSILTKIIDNLINAPMALCDLSSRNPNVLYELGIRQAFDKPVVLVHEYGSMPIFDISDITTIRYRKDRKYDEVLEDQTKIIDAIKSTAQNNKSSSVIQLANLQQATSNAVENLPPDQLDIMRSVLFDLQVIKKNLSNKATFTDSTADLVAEAVLSRLNVYPTIKNNEMSKSEIVELAKMRDIEMQRLNSLRAEIFSLERQREELARMTELARKDAEAMVEVARREAARLEAARNRNSA